MKIKVTYSHIQEGSPSERGSCPIALALTQYGFLNVEVLLTKFVHSYRDTVVYLPITVTKFIKSFDSGKVVKPFEFEI